MVGDRTRFRSIPRPPVTKSNSSPKSNKVSNIFKKAGAEWNLFLARIKSLGEEVFSEDQVIKEIFVESDTDYLLDKIDKVTRGYSINEERFLSQYQKYKNLDKMYENNQQRVSSLNNTTEDIKSSSTAFSDNHNRFSLKDVIRQTNSSCSTPLMNQQDPKFETGSSTTKVPEPLDSHLELDSELVDDIEDVEDDDDLDEDTSNDLSDKGIHMTFNDLDVVRLKERFDNDNDSLENNNNEDATSNQSETNIGEVLWEYRRSLWLKSSKGEMHVSTTSLLFDQIPKESYVTIYNNLVDKGRSLKANRKINLHDLIRVINAGWESEEKWERAAKGLP